jgi:hypothetical protein
MSIMHRDRRPVNPTVVFDSRRPTPRPFFGGPELVEVEPRTLLDEVLEELGYDAVAIGAAKSWLAHRHTIAGCPVIRPSDWFVVNNAALDPTPPPPPTFPTPVPVGAYHPTPAESRWAALAFAS